MEDTHGEIPDWCPTDNYIQRLLRWLFPAETYYCTRFGNIPWVPTEFFQYTHEYQIVSLVFMEPHIVHQYLDDLIIMRTMNNRGELKGEPLRDRIKQFAAEVKAEILAYRNKTTKKQMLKNVTG